MSNVYSAGVRPWDEVRAELKKRHGICIRSNRLVQQIARRAEQKIMAEIARLLLTSEIGDEEPRTQRWNPLAEAKR
jgi:hypothetical protein